jgi:hypothetical protein
VLNSKVFVDADYLKKLKDLRKGKIDSFMKKFEQQKQEKTKTSDIIDSIFDNSRKQTELEVNLVSSRILLKKDQYTEHKKEI